MDIEDQKMLSSSSSSESSDDENDKNEQLQNIAALLQVTQQNPRDYDGHVKLIQALRFHGDIDLMRLAREAFHSQFPLSKGWTYSS